MIILEIPNEIFEKIGKNLTFEYRSQFIDHNSWSMCFKKNKNCRHVVRMIFIRKCHGILHCPLCL